MQDSVHRPQAFEEKGEPKRIQTEVPLLTANALALGQTGSHNYDLYFFLDILSRLRHDYYPQYFYQSDQCIYNHETSSFKCSCCVCGYLM